MVQSLALSHPIAGVQTSTSDLFLISVERYEAMIRSGIITAEDNIELIHGKLIKKMGKNEPHILVAGLLMDWLVQSLPRGWFVSIENPIRMPDSLPEPYAVIVRGERREYGNRRFTPSEIAVVVEIADTTLDSDPAIRLSLYAGAGIAVYWIANINARQIEVYTLPQTGDPAPFYRSLMIYTAADSIPLILDGAQVASIAAADLLP
ncbi:MAG: Uma2 family endonuclease [Chloroflexota bacterium]|nr:Uma2 family endonuclease [Chloroflexota bacterium]